jgi:hypothetical protein
MGSVAKRAGLTPVVMFITDVMLTWLGLQLSLSIL